MPRVAETTTTHTSVPTQSKSACSSAPATAQKGRPEARRRRPFTSIRGQRRRAADCSNARRRRPADRRGARHADAARHASLPVRSPAASVQISVFVAAWPHLSKWASSRRKLRKSIGPRPASPRSLHIDPRDRRDAARPLSDQRWPALRHRRSVAPVARRCRWADSSLAWREARHDFAPSRHEGAARPALPHLALSPAQDRTRARHDRSTTSRRAGGSAINKNRRPSAR